MEIDPFRPHTSRPIVVGERRDVEKAVNRSFQAAKTERVWVGGEVRYGHVLEQPYGLLPEETLRSQWRKVELGVVLGACVTLQYGF